MTPIRVVVQGASGKMGREVIKFLCREPEFQLVGAVELKVSDNFLVLPDTSAKVPFSSDLEYILVNCQPDVIIDFSTTQAAMSAVRIAVNHEVSLVIGTTGLNTEQLDEIDYLAKAYNVGVVVATNFALGAILMINLAKIAAKYFDFAEIIEQHHNSKVDAPSGTALTTVKAMLESKNKSFNKSLESKPSQSRGQQIEGITIHSVRLPGILACQEVILGDAGQTLSIKHNTISRECYMPGIMLATREVTKHKGLIYGLDTLLGL